LTKFKNFFSFTREIVLYELQELEATRLFQLKTEFFQNKVPLLELIQALFLFGKEGVGPGYG
jgi:hypothetical protein